MDKRLLVLLVVLLGGCGATTGVRVPTVDGAPEDSIAVLLVPAHHHHLTGSNYQSLHLKAVSARLGRPDETIPA